jgi:hypothetical protein
MPFLLIALLHCQSCLPMQSCLSSLELHVRCVAFTRLAPPKVGLPSPSLLHLHVSITKFKYIRFPCFCSTQTMTKNSSLILSLFFWVIILLFYFFSFCCLMKEVTMNNPLIVVIVYSNVFGCLL